VPWPFLRLYSNRLPSWVKNCRLSGDADSERGEIHTSSMIRCSRPILYVEMCYKRAMGVVAACRWDVGRQCGAEETRGNSSQSSDFRLVRNFFATLRAPNSHYAPNLRRAKTAPGAASSGRWYVYYLDHLLFVLI
jgi:hypothetical protein